MDLNNDTNVTQHGATWVITRSLPLSGLSVATVLGAPEGTLLEELSQTFDSVECTEKPEAPYFEDRDNAEYVYSVSETVEMCGKKYEEVRRKYNQVQNAKVKAQSENNQVQSAKGKVQSEDDRVQSAKFKVQSEDKQVQSAKFKVQSEDEQVQNAKVKVQRIGNKDLGSKVQSVLWSFFERQTGAVGDIDAQVEGMAFEKWLMFAEQLSTDLIVVAEDSTIVGFSVVEVVGKTLLVHFFKTDHTVSGLAEFLFVEIARMYQDQIEWINFQQDLGIEGLRKFKEHLQPMTKLITFFVR